MQYRFQFWIQMVHKSDFIVRNETNPKLLIDKLNKIEKKIEQNLADFFSDIGSFCGIMYSL